MALHVNYDKMVGWYMESDEERDYIVNLYECNAMVAAIYRNTEKDMEYLQWFIVDDAHLKNMLGLSKGTYTSFMNNIESWYISKEWKDAPKFIKRLYEAACKYKKELSVCLY